MNNKYIHALKFKNKDGSISILDLSNFMMPAATLEYLGLVQLSNATDLDDETKAATAKAVKLLNDRLNNFNAEVSIELTDDYLLNDSTIAASAKAVFDLYGYLIEKVNTSEDKVDNHVSVGIIGESILFNGNNPPSNLIVEDGRLLNINDYPLLYEQLGNDYGGDGVTTFGIPDKRIDAPKSGVWMIVAGNDNGSISRLYCSPTVYCGVYHSGEQVTNE